MANNIYSQLYSPLYAVKLVLSATQPPIYSRLYSQLFARYPTFTVTGMAASLTVGTSYDTTSYNASTGAGIMGSTGAAPMTQCWDVASRWANDAAFRANIANFNLTGRPTWIYSNSALNGTGTYPTCQYTDGRFVDLVQWQNSVQYASQPTFAYQVIGANQASSAPTCNLASAAPTGTYSVWMAVRRLYQSGWTNVGDADNTNGGATFNAGQNAAFKAGLFINYSMGRAGMTTGNGSGSTAQIDVENGPGGTNGLSETWGGFNFGSEWTNGLWYDYLIRCTQFLGNNGHVWTECTVWERQIGSASYTRISARLTGDTLLTSGTQISEFYSTCLNMNQSFKTTESYWQWGYAAWDQAANADPMGVVAQEAAATPGVPVTNTFNSQTGGSITCNVEINLYTAALRPVVDGTPVVGQDFTIIQQVPEGGTVSPTVTGVPTGTHTIGWEAVNANNSATSAQSTTIMVTV